MRYHRWVLIAICAAAFSVLCVVSPVQANEGNMQATVGKPATIAISGASAHLPVDGSARIVVTVNAYEPSKTGPVATVVSVRCSEGLRKSAVLAFFRTKRFPCRAGPSLSGLAFCCPTSPPAANRRQSKSASNLKPAMVPVPVSLSAAQASNKSAIGADLPLAAEAFLRQMNSSRKE
ncbi:hypothetical protein ACOJBM_43275 [Rhizobium beringeri]